MSSPQHTYPVADLHCDMTHYLATVENASPDNTEQIGCATPYLRQGNVALQVMAISSVEETPDLAVSDLQIEWYKKLLTDHGDYFVAVKRRCRIPESHRLRQNRHHTVHRECLVILRHR